MLSIAVLGAGRMGQQVCEAIEASEDCRLAGVWSRNSSKPDSSSQLGDNDLPALLANCDVAVDFTLAEATPEILAAAIAAARPLVSGVTGHGESQMDELERAGTHIPLLHERNMSIGISLLKQLLPQAAAALGNEFAAEIHETHHVHKLDAPSGTALMLGEVLANSRDVAADAVDYHVTREGEVAGDHSIVFRAAGESISLSHSVTNRRVFADGALAAARWLVGKPPGRYYLADMLSE